MPAIFWQRCESWHIPFTGMARSYTLMQPALSKHNMILGERIELMLIALLALKEGLSSWNLRDYD